MKSRTKKIWTMGCTAAFGLAMTVAVSAGDIGGAVKTACSTCHSTKRICLNIGVKNAKAWKATVTDMVGKGAQLPANRIDEAADYLTGLAPGTGTVCK